MKMTERAAQRQALADKIRGEHLRSTRRRRIATMITVVCAALVGAVVIVWLQLNPGNEDEIAAPNNVSDTYGFVLTPELANGGEAEAGEEAEIESESAPGVTPLALYEDFLCDSCQVFHEQSGAFLAEQLEAGRISVTYYPGAYLLTQSTDEYSQRAANAAVCVGDQTGAVGYAAMHGLLLANQPAQGGPGLSDDELIEFAEQAGAKDVGECVRDRVFGPWVEEASAAALATGVTETPTIRVAGLNVVRSDNGRESMPGPDELAFALEATQ